MATRVRIQCINKSNRYNPHERIINIGGVNPNLTRWKLHQEEAIKGIEDGTYAFYVHAGGREVNVIVAKSAYGHKYLTIGRTAPPSLATRQ